MTEAPEATSAIRIGHEKLRVYQDALRYVVWVHDLLDRIESDASALEHWPRAAESVVENLANGNSRRSTPDRVRYFDVSIGSALESAACTDVCVRKGLVNLDHQAESKEALQQVVRMTVGLRKASSECVRDGQSPYGAGDEDQDVRFPHERLDVYQLALEMISTLDSFVATSGLGATYSKRLDKHSTSLVLNIAEGNGRFSHRDQIRFLDIAHTSAVRIGACLDVLTARRQVLDRQAEDSRRLLHRIIPMLLGLRGCLDDKG